MIIDGMTLAGALAVRKEETAATKEKDEAMRGGVAKVGGEIMPSRAPARTVLDAVEDETKTDARRGPKGLLPWGRWKSRHQLSKRAGDLREGPERPGKQGRLWRRVVTGMTKESSAPPTSPQTPGAVEEL